MEYYNCYPIVENRYSYKDNKRAKSMKAESTELNDIAKKVLLNPEECVLVLIDYEPQMFFAVKSMDIQLLKNNVMGLSEACNLFNVPVILTTIDAKTFSGPVIQELQAVLPDVVPIDRTIINTWQDERVVNAIKATNKKKIIMGALWTEVCLCLPVLCALEEGYEVYIVVDAVGGTSPVAHEYAIERMIQKGAVPVTWQQVMLEFQRDWAREETAGDVLRLAQKYSGAYGIGIEYADFALDEFKLLK